MSCGACMADLPVNLSQMLRQSAARFADRPAVTLGDKTMSFAELDGVTTALAAGLVRLGVEPGDRVAFDLPNCPQFVMAYFAASRAGAIGVPINTMLGAEEVAYALQHSGAKVCLTVDALAPVVAQAVQQSPGVRDLFVSGEKLPKGAQPFASLLAPPEGPVEFPEALPDDVAVIKYTSGTTGRPKGAMLTHRNLIFDAAACEDAILIVPDDVFITVLPLFHCFGATVCMNLPLLLGAHSVLLPRFSATSCLGAIESYRGTVFAGVPSMFAVMLQARSERDFDLSSLRLCVTGGAPIAAQVFSGFRDRFQVDMLEGYGPTEAAPVVTVNPLQGVRKLGSVGPPIPGVELRMLNDEGRELPVGEEGEVCVRGDNVMAGYWQDEEATAKVIVDGWLHTGDLGRLDEDGYLYISGRIKELIITGGMKTHPREIEEVIEQLPQVAEVAVIGVQDALRTETPVAFVVPKPGQSINENDIIAHCREHLATYKVPSKVIFRDQFPRNATGKILKRSLAELVDGG